MESSSPPQNEFGGSGSGSTSSFNFNSSLNLKIGKEKKQKDKFGSTHALEDERHQVNTSSDPSQKKIAKWRMRERMRTISVALVYCLNIGVDPPDSAKTDPCARMECWIDPMSQAPQKALENIGKALQVQYERWHPRARYKLCLDPTVEEVKKLCLSLRRNAKDERVLFHYNGHGVPRPTSNGEIWVFNKNFTQYIPLSIYELQTWMGSPTIYVFDSSAAGLIVNWFLQFAEQREKEYERMLASAAANSATSVVPIKDFIILASCGANELLPMNPDLPADVFTSCLTTPIKMALRWFCSNSVLIKKGINFDLVDKIPGRLTDRKTPIGELNWIFTAITDTIAWNVLPRDLFQKLFRQDLLVASLFRNFLLADRIMRSLNCNPISFPKLPATHLHPMWQAWDLAVDLCLSQLPEILEDPSIEYKNSPFFTEQLSAFEVWLQFGSEHKKPPEQLPIVLQVLLSQAHRLRALVLLARFLDLGPWAVNLTLSVGIFPYVLKLLQSPAVELRQVLVFIWTKILALDKSTQLDLVKDNGHNYFLSVLSSSTVASDQRTMTAFILSVIANNCRPGQSACLNGNLLTICLSQLSDPDPMLRRWLLLCIAKLWESFEDAKWAAIREAALERVSSFLSDAVAEVRAAAVYALGLFIGGAEGSEQRVNLELNIAITLPVVTEDGSPMVRRELIIALSRIVRAYEQNFKEVARDHMTEEAKLKEREEAKKKGIKADEEEEKKNPHSSVFPFLWKLIIALLSDPYPQIARMADSIIKSVSPAPPVVQTPTMSRSASTNNLKVTGVKAKSQKNKLLNLSKSGTGMNKSLSVNTSMNQNSNNSSNVLSPNSSGVLSPANPMSPASPGFLRKTASVDFSKFDQPEEDNSLINPQLPTDELHSTFYDWACEYYSKPLLLPDPIPNANNNSNTNTNTNASFESPDEEEEAIGRNFTEKIWREARIKSNLQEAQSLIDNTSAKPKLDEQVAILDNTPESSNCLLLHPFEPLIVIADDKDGISVWDREVCTRVHYFRNRTFEDDSNSSVAPLTRTTSMQLINETSKALLATGSDDGVVRIWNAFDEPSKFRLVTAWRAFPSLVPTSVSRSKGAGLILNWQPEHGLMLSSGDVGVIRIWDLEREHYVQDIPTGSESCVTSMSYNPSADNRVVVAGCGDGSLRIFDFRTPPKYSLAATFIEHKEWVLNVQIPKGNPHTIVSGSIAGTVKFWDMRSPVSYKTIQAYNKNVMTALTVHDYAPVFACGSHNQKIKIYNFAGDELSLIRYHDGFLGQRIGPVSCLSFHPYLLLFAAGATDSIVSLYSKPTIAPK